MPCSTFLATSFTLERGFTENTVQLKADGTPLLFGLGKHFAYGLQHTKALISNDEFHPIRITATQLLDEVGPAGFVLFHAFGSTQNFTVSVLIDRHCYQNGYIFKLSAPISA